MSCTRGVTILKACVAWLTGFQMGILLFMCMQWCVKGMPVGDPPLTLHITYFPLALLVGNALVIMTVMLLHWLFVKDQACTDDGEAKCEHASVQI